MKSTVWVLNLRVDYKQPNRCGRKFQLKKNYDPAREKCQILLNKNIWRSKKVAHTEKITELFKNFNRTSPRQPPLGRNKHLTYSLRWYWRRSSAAWIVEGRISRELCWFCHRHVWNSRAQQRMDLNCRRWQPSWWADDNFHPFGMTYILK